MNDLVLTGETPLYLDPTILKKLNSYDDFLSTFIQLDQATSSFSWLKADLLSELVKRKGVGGVTSISRDIKCPLSTITNYIRTARAFPPEKRVVNASFSLHYQASFADSYNSKTFDFTGAKRFEWLEKAVDNNMSRRRLAEYIDEEKTRTATQKAVICQFCELSDGEVGLYILFSSSQKFRAKMRLHSHCRDEILASLKVQPTKPQVV
jgi:hypothetical protein